MSQVLEIHFLHIRFLAVNFLEWLFVKLVLVLREWDGNSKIGYREDAA